MLCVSAQAFSSVLLVLLVALTSAGAFFYMSPESIGVRRGTVSVRRQVDTHNSLTPRVESARFQLIESTSLSRSWFQI